MIVYTLQFCKRMLKGQFANDVKKYTNISKQNRPWVLAMQKHPMQTHKAKAENGTVKHHDCQFLKNVVLFESRSQETVHQNHRSTYCYIFWNPKSAFFFMNLCDVFNEIYFLRCCNVCFPPKPQTNVVHFLGIRQAGKTPNSCATGLPRPIQPWAGWYLLAWGPSASLCETFL